MTEDNVGKHRKLVDSDKFNFSCHKGLSCFNKCCGNVNIFLTPYDVLRLKQALHMTSTKFLKKYTVSLLSEQKFSMVLLKMKNNKEKSCPLVTVEGCSVYNDRPWACRMYPIDTVTNSKEEGYDEEYRLMVNESSTCLGRSGRQEWTISEWIKDQGVDIYNRKNELYNLITSNKLFREGKGIGWEQAQMLYVALYDIDRFRKLIFNSTFFKRFEIGETLKQKIKVNDEALLQFGYDWLRFSLFGEDTITIHGDVAGENKTKKIKTGKTASKKAQT